MNRLNYEKVFKTLVEETGNYLVNHSLRAMVLGVSGGIDPRAVKRLNRITDATKAKIVVSSTWRSDSNLQEVFTLVGIKEPIYDVTPYMRSRHRGSEIQEWLDKQTEPYRYVILDDDSDMLDCQLPYFIQTDWLKWGLSDEDVEQAIHILNDTAA